VLGSRLENAVVHSEAGTVVRCALRVDDGGAAVLQVSNRAPGLERADLAHVFERFWRKDGARTDGAHAGLGLTLARASADLLGLELSARLDDGELIMSLLVPGELVVSADVVA
jgi:signal transduction histidine kinase